MGYWADRVQKERDARKKENNIISPSAEHPAAPGLLKTTDKGLRVIGMHYMLPGAVIGGGLGLGYGLYNDNADPVMSTIVGAGAGTVGGLLAGKFFVDPIALAKAK